MQLLMVLPLSLPDNRINLVGTSGEANNFTISVSDNATSATLPVNFTNAQQLLHPLIRMEYLLD